MNITYDKNKIYLGELVKFTIKIDSDINIKNINSNLKNKLQDFGISEITKNLDNKKVVYNFNLQFFKTGTVKIPSIEFNITTEKGNYKIYSNSLNVDILSNLKDNESFHDIKPPEKVGFYLTTREFLILSIIISLIILLMFLFRYLKNRISTKEHSVKLSPIEEFNDRCKICEKLLNRSDLKGFYFKISEAARIYFDRIYNIHTLEATIKEIKYIFENNLSVDGSIKNEIINLFKKWDFYKFTGNFPSIEEAKKDFRKIKNIIELIEELTQQKDKNNV